MPEMNWYYNDGGKRAGPLSQEQLCELFARGQVPIETTVWSDAIGAWVAASAIAGFRDAACSAPKASILETHGFQNAVAHVSPDANIERRRSGCRVSSSSRVSTSPQNHRGGHCRNS